MRIQVILIAVGVWVLLGVLLSVFGGPHEAHSIEGVQIFSDQVNLGAFEVSQAVLISWFIIAALIILAILFRLLVAPRFKDTPTGAQNMMEAGLEALDGFAKGLMGHPSDTLTCYLFTLAIFLVGCAMAELFALRAPSADIVVTGTLAVITFFLINYYGFKVKGVKGRLKYYAEPMPFMVPFKIISDIAVPISLACRLFGNMLGGMIVMELVRNALAYFAIGPVAIAGLFFNVFHPLIQVYIFLTLSLTFINEAVE